MKKVITTLRGTNHCLAYCVDCDWDSSASGSRERQEQRNALHKHIKETGHKGSIETGLVSHYELEK